MPASPRQEIPRQAFVLAGAGNACCGKRFQKTDPSLTTINSAWRPRSARRNSSRGSARQASDRAACGPWRKLDSYFALRDGWCSSPVKLHGRDAIANLECQSGRQVQCDMFRHLADDGRELLCRHLVGRVVDVPKLDEQFRPTLGIGAAVERRELTRLSQPRI